MRRTPPGHLNIMKTVCLIRYGAYGDHVHMSNVVRQFHEDGWRVTFEYNTKGAALHTYNPRIHAHQYFEPYITDKEVVKPQQLRRRWFNMEPQFDKFVNFQNSLENTLIEDEKFASYFWPLWMRREKNTHICYYDQSMKWAGYTEQKYMGRSGELFFPKEEHEFVKKWLEPYRDTFLILYAWRGTMHQKATYPMVEEVCKRWLEKNQDTTIITTGDEFCQKWEASLTHPRIIHRAGRMPFRQALLMSRYMDLVVTPETGLGIGAGAYGTPKIMLLTAASIKNIVGNDENDYSLQSEAYCSPCTRAIYNIDNCPVTKINGEVHPICVDFDKDLVLARIQEVYDAGHARNWDEGKIWETVVKEGPNEPEREVEVYV